LPFVHSHSPRVEHGLRCIDSSHAHARMHAHTHIHTHAHAHAYAHAHTHTHTHTHSAMNCRSTVVNNKASAPRLRNIVCSKCVHDVKQGKWNQQQPSTETTVLSLQP
jgi:hypothetical protein